MNTGIFQKSYDSAPYYCAKLSLLLSEMATDELVFALAPPTTAALEEQHARLLHLAHVAHRRHNDLHPALPVDMFRNANWAIMLACFQALLERRTLCVKHIQSLLDQSHTALLRHIDALEEHRLVGRQRDPQDRRRTLVLLSGRGAAAMADYLERCGRDATLPASLASPKAIPSRQERSPSA